jgi:uncharacterized protein YeaO (DUF488 family)
VRLGTPRKKDEGLRLGTVRRPPRGVRKSEFAARDFYDVWMPNLSPSPELLESVHSKPDASNWKRFARQFRAEMKRPEAAHLLDLLAALSERTNFAIGCYCEHEELCHRSILKALLAEREARFS